MVSFLNLDFIIYSFLLTFITTNFFKNLLKPKDLVLSCLNIG